MTKIEYFISKQDGTAKPLSAGLETSNGKYVRPKAENILEIPGRHGVGRKRKIVIWPEGSMTAFPLASTRLQPDTMKAQDLKNLYGPLVPNALNDITDIPTKTQWEKWVLLGLTVLSVILNIVLIVMLHRFQGRVF